MGTPEADNAEMMLTLLAAIERRDRRSGRSVVRAHLADAVPILRVHVRAVLPEVGDGSRGSRRRSDTEDG